MATKYRSVKPSAAEHRDSWTAMEMNPAIALARHVNVVKHQSHDTVSEQPDSQQAVQHTLAKGNLVWSMTHPTPSARRTLAITRLRRATQ